MHQIEILRAPYVPQLFFWIFGACFQLKIPMYLSRRILFSLLKLKNKSLFLKVRTKFSWTNTLEFWAEIMPQKSKKKKLKNIRSPQNFDLMHSLGAKYIHFKSGLVKPDYLQRSYLGDLNEPCQPNFSINMCGRQCRFWGSCNLGLDLFPERCVSYSSTSSIPVLRPGIFI